MGPLQAFLARIRRLSSHNCLEFPRKGLRVSSSVTLFGTPQSQPRLVNIIAIRNVDVDDVTSASVIVNGGGDGEKVEEKR